MLRRRKSFNPRLNPIEGKGEFRGRAQRLGGRPSGGGKKRMSQVTSLFRLAAAFPSRPRRSSGFPFSRLLAFLASALLSARPLPKLGPRARRALANNSPSRLARRLRKPPAAAFARRDRRASPSSRSRPGIPGREAQVPRSVRAPADRLAAPDFRRRLRQPPAARLTASTPPRPFRPPFASPSPKRRLFRVRWRRTGNPVCRLASRLRRTACRPLSRAVSTQPLGTLQ